MGGKLNWASVATNGISAGVGYLAEQWVDVKNGGNIQQVSANTNPQAARPESYWRMSASGEKFANPSMMSDVTLTGGWAPGVLEKYNAENNVVVLPKIVVTAPRWSAAEELAAQTADKLMQINQFNMKVGKYALGATEIAVSGVYNQAVRIGGGLASIPYAAFDSANAATSVQDGFNERFGYNLRSDGAKSIVNGLSPLANKVNNGIQSLRSASEDTIGLGATALTFGTVQAGLEIAGVVGGGAAVKGALGQFGKVESVVSSAGVNPQAVLEGVVNRAVTDLNANPGLARDLMSPGSYRQLTNGTNLAPASYGKAIERLTARYVKEDPSLSSVLSYQSRPFVSTPDFLGYNGYDLHLLDITTEASIPKHLERSYGPATEYVTYPSMPKNLVFPK